jgi:y4mF family transcriptional regulator
MDVKTLGQMLRARRKALGLTQQDIGDEAGVGIVFVSQVENGKGTAEIGKVFSLIAALGFDIELRERP